MSRRAFQLVDVFGSAPFSGNPLAVVSAADDLDADNMQAIARWLNLSESAFLCRPTEARADYRIRIFTLERELPFAGHPTLGSCHAWLGGGGVPQNGGTIVQQCRAGLVEVQRNADGLLAFAAPRLIRDGAVDDDKLAEVSAVLGIERSEIVEAKWVDNGPGWVGVMLKSAADVLALRPARSHAQRIDIGVVGPHAAGEDAAFEVRAFFSDHHGALIEDPVTGSLNASIAQWMFASGRVGDAYVAAQGTALGRRGRVMIHRDATGQVWVAGRTRTLFSGQGELVE